MSMLCPADVPLFGVSGYDPKNERPDDVPFYVQLEGMVRVVRAGKVRDCVQHVTDPVLPPAARSKQCLPALVLRAAMSRLVGWTCL